MTTAEAAGARGLRVRAAGADRDLLLAAVKAHGEALASRRGILKDEHKTAITRIDCRGRSLVVKHYRFMGSRLLLKGLFRMHPGRRSLEASLAMQRRAQPCPTPLGLVERAVFGLVAESWFVCDEVAGAVDMDRYAARHFDGGADPGRRRRFVFRFAEVLANLMRSGIHHGDLKTCNILVIEKGDRWDFAFIDLDDVTVHPRATVFSRDVWVLTLAQLNSSLTPSVSRTDRLRFLDRLSDLDRFDRRKLARDAEELSRGRGRGYFTDDGMVKGPFV